MLTAVENPWKAKEHQTEKNLHLPSPYILTKMMPTQKIYCPFIRVFFYVWVKAETNRIYDGVEAEGKFSDYSRLIRGSAEDETRII